MNMRKAITCDVMSCLLVLHRIPALGLEVELRTVACNEYLALVFFCDVTDDLDILECLCLFPVGSPLCDSLKALALLGKAILEVLKDEL